MVVVMPLFLGFITFNFPAGLGIFWITGQVFQGVTDFILLKKAGLPFKLPFMK
jgi:membrane protein insertase Oxa1/YidC/SpoIIIJ